MIGETLVIQMMIGGTKLLRSAIGTATTITATDDDTTTIDDNSSSADDATNPHWVEIFFVYFAYIVGFIILVFLFDKCQIFDRWVHSLVLKSQANLHPHILKSRGITQEASDARNHEQSQKEIKGECCDCLCGGKQKVSTELKEYKVEYLVNMLDRPSYLATTPVQTPSNEGFLCGLRGILELIQFPPGFFLDFLLYVMNNHSILSMFLSVKGHPYSRAEKRSTFFCQNCLALGFAVFIDAVGWGQAGAVLFNIFVVSPTMIMLKKQLYYALACPCLRSCHERGGCSACCASCLEGLGFFVLLPIIGIALVFLLMAAMYTHGLVRTAGYRIAGYAYSVHVISSIQEIVLIWAMFFWTGRYSLKVSFCCIPLATFGTYYNEKVRCGFTEGVDYLKIPKQNYFCGLIRVERVVEKDLWDRTGGCLSCSRSASNQVVPAPQPPPGVDTIPVQNNPPVTTVEMAGREVV